MKLDILQQILSELKEVKQSQARLETNVSKLESTISKLEITIENEVKHNIKIIAENHLSLNQKLDELKGINEKVFSIQNDTDILKSITKDNLYHLKALKSAK